MTFGSLTALILFVYICYFMMRKGGGCCGGHDHGKHSNTTDHQGHGNKSASSLEHHHEQQESDKKGKDPVCGMDAGTNSPVSEYKGKTYRFCSDQCRKLFDLNPHKYANL